MMHTERTEFLDVIFDCLTMKQILSEMRSAGPSTPFRFVVTPNVDHVVRLHRKSAEAQTLANAYQAAHYCVCDSRILAGLARLRGVRLTIVPGSDLTGRLLTEVVQPGDRVALVGGDPEMVRALENRFPNVEFVLHCPPMGLVRNHAARQTAARFVAKAGARFALICVGSPQQEMIATEVAMMNESRGIALCVGASLDFLTARQKRAPDFMRKVGLEWLHRLCTNPRRLWRRYLLEGPKIFLLVIKWRRRLA